MKATVRGPDFSARGIRKAPKVKDRIDAKRKSDAQALDHATTNLLRALKRDMLKREGRVDLEKLRKEGYSERLLAKLEQA